MKKTESKKQKAKKVVSIEKIILFLAASFAAYNFGLAGGYIEGTQFSIGGLIAGIVVNITIAIAASRFGALKGDKRTRQATIAFIAMMFLSPLLVAPVIFYSLPETFLGMWPLRAAWAVSWPLAADLAIVLAGAVSGKGLIALSEPGAKVANAVQRTKSQNAKSALDSHRDASQSVAVRRTYPRKCEHCTEMLRTANSIGAHMKKHHPELCKSKTSLAAALFTPVESKQ